MNTPPVPLRPNEESRQTGSRAKQEKERTLGVEAALKHLCVRRRDGQLLRASVAAKDPYALRLAFLDFLAEMREIGFR